MTDIVPPGARALRRILFAITNGARGSVDSLHEALNSQHDRAPRAAAVTIALRNPGLRLLEERDELTETDMQRLSDQLRTPVWYHHGATEMCDAEVIVIGAGIMGVAAGNALARAGRRVIVLEQFGPGHDRGSSHGTARVFKVSYPDPAFVRLAKAALVQWRELEEETGVELLATTGSIDVGGIAGRREALDQCGATYEFLDAAGVNRRFRLRIDDDADALFQPDGGVLHADRAHEAFVRAGRARGATFVYGTSARRLALGHESVVVGTSAGDVRAHAAVVTAGAWLTRIVRPLGLQPIIAPARETVAYFQPRLQLQTPPLSDWRPQEKHVIYGIVARDGLLKVGVSGSGVPTDPDEHAEVDRAIVRDAAVWAARRYELMDDAPVASETCLYTNTPDERFIIERHGRLVIGSACSGHGFKFAPVIGDRLASLALEAIAA